MMNHLYQRPFPQTIEARVGHPTGEYAHENFPEIAHAIDFLLPIGTPILAARDGTVKKLKSDSDRYGLDKKFANDANYVAVKHDDDTFIEYVHLGKNQIVVQKGQNVKTGDLLGYSGLSGCMSEQHLHLNLFRIEGEKAVSLPLEIEGLTK